jgi:hypothetical protein
MIVSSTWENDGRRRQGIFEYLWCSRVARVCPEMWWNRTVLHPVSWILIGNIDGKMNTLCEIVLNHGPFCRTTSHGSYMLEWPESTKFASELWDNVWTVGFVQGWLYK